MGDSEAGQHVQVQPFRSHCELVTQYESRDAGEIPLFSFDHFRQDLAKFFRSLGKGIMDCTIKYFFSRFLWQHCRIPSQDTRREESSELEFGHRIVSIRIDEVGQKLGHFDSAVRFLHYVQTSKSAPGGN